MLTAFSTMKQSAIERHNLNRRFVCVRMLVRPVEFEPSAQAFFVCVV
jgi:hypothetical protein